MVKRDEVWVKLNSQLTLLACSVCQIENKNSIDFTLWQIFFRRGENPIYLFFCVTNKEKETKISAGIEKREEEAANNY